MIDNKTQLNMVIGYPLSHTQSPILHNAIYHALHCNAVMLAHATDELSATMQALRTLSVGLTAVTMPYKENILAYLDDISVEAKATKAVNTVINRDGELLGYNTDIDGIAFALREVNLSNKNVLIIGAGGAAQAAAYYLKHQHANLLWLNRTPQRATAIAESFGGKIINIENINDLSIDIIINATPLGMFPNINSTPLPNYAFKSHQVVFDMVYNPINSLLIRNAESSGATTISGLNMFIGQGIKQIELWLQQTIDTSNILDSIKAKLIAAQQNAGETI